MYRISRSGLAQPGIWTLYGSWWVTCGPPRPAARPPRDGLRRCALVEPPLSLGPAAIAVPRFVEAPGALLAADCPRGARHADAEARGRRSERDSLCVSRTEASPRGSRRGVVVGGEVHSILHRVRGGPGCARGARQARW